MEASPELILVVIAVIEFGRRISVRDWFAVYTIAAAALVGVIAGAANIYGVPTPADGLVLGLSASGAITLVSAVKAKKAEVVPEVPATPAPVDPANPPQDTPIFDQ